MQSSTPRDPEKSPVHLLGMSGSPNKHESSGLYDLRSLASSTKKRRTKRVSSQMDVQASILQTSASLGAIALPQPNKSESVILKSTALDSSTVSTEIDQPDSFKIKSSSEYKQITSNTKYFIIGALGLIATGVSLFMFFGSSDKQESAGEVSSSTIGQTNALATAALVPAELKIQNEELLVATDDKDEVEELAAMEKGKGSQKTVGKEAESLVAINADKSTNNMLVNVKKKNENKSKFIKEKQPAQKESLVKKSVEPKVAPKKKIIAQNGKTPVLGKNGASLDDVLNSVTGGIDKAVVVEKNTGPSKEKLTGKDVSKAMKSVRGAAKSCYSVENYSGNVIVKYSVARTGNITKAKATGTHSNSKTGKCVAKAVRSASFPAFSGSPQSFSFPFLLSP